MKRLRLAALLIGLSPTLALGAVKNATKAQVLDSGTTDVPVTVGIEADLPQVAPGTQLGHWGVGNGGDWMRINFARAREYAANVVLRINPLSLSRVKDEAIKKWIFDNQKFLAADIMQTEHVWVAEAKSTCAWTLKPKDKGGQIPTAYPIEFSYPTCRTQLKCDKSATPADPNAPIDFLEVAQLLIHEAVHHFDGEEAEADKIAIAIVDAWRSGMMDSIPLGMTNAPAGTYKHSAVWTGDRMIVVAGTTDDKPVTYVNTVTSYDPIKGVWTDITPPSSLNFTPRLQPTVVWTGKHVLIWGGFVISSSGSTKWTYDGALYNPADGSWRKVAIPATTKVWGTPKVPTTVTDYPWQTLVWTGDKAIIWGGVDTSSSSYPLGAIYDPSKDDKDAWTVMNTTDAAAPKVLYGHSAVWTGTQMIVWGGVGTSSSVIDTGSIYDLASNTWKKMTTGNIVVGSEKIPTGSPTARAGHQAVWTGSQMVVISGGGSGTSTDLTSTGALYSPSTDTWTPYRSEQMIERYGHRAVWNGEEVLVVGGLSKRLFTYFGDVYAFNPATLRWRVLAGKASAPVRFFPSIVWTGSSALVWGGTAADGAIQRSGAQFFP